MDFCLKGLETAFHIGHFFIFIVTLTDIAVSEKTRLKRFFL